MILSPEKAQIRKSSHPRTRRAPTGVAEVFRLIPRYCRYVSQQSPRVGDHRIGIESARCLRRPALRKGLHLALQPHACALGTLGPLLAHDKTLETVMALPA